MGLSICLEDISGKVLDQKDDETMVKLQIEREYQYGDKIVIQTDIWPLFLEIVVDKNCPEAVVYLPADRMEFLIPYGKELEAYSPNAFTGTSHILSVKKIKNMENSYRNLSYNPLDCRGETTCYPHCIANVETRDESVFAARNTIDGSKENEGHGKWPYTSWGDNENPNAEITIQFGRDVWVNQVEILLRADFPHDNYWKEVTLLFSDKSSILVTLEKSKKVQTIRFADRKVAWVKMKKLMKSDEESAFPALTQWDVFGKEASDLGVYKATM